MTAYSRGNSSRDTGCAPLDIKAILSEKKYDMPFINAATANAIFRPVCPPIAPPTITRSTLNRMSNAPVRRIFMKSPAILSTQPGAQKFH
jgi:hypothetical protein